MNLFYALKLGPQSKESANFFNKVWVNGGTMIVDLYLKSVNWFIDSARVIHSLRAEMTWTIPQSVSVSLVNSFLVAPMITVINFRDP